MIRFLYIFSLFLLFGCEKEIINTPDDYVPYVVVNSIISTDSTFSVNLSYSKSIYDRDDFTPVEDASIYIAVKDEFNIRRQEFTLNYVGNGLYTRDNRPVEGKTYDMLIEVDGEVISAETYVPKVFDACIKKTKSLTIDSKKSFSFEIAINGNDISQDYYAWDIEKIRTEDEEVKVPVIEETLQSDIAEDGTKEDGSTSSEENSVVLRSNGNGPRPIQIDKTGSIIANFTPESIESDSGSNSNTNEISSEDPTGQPSTGNQKYKLKVWAISSDYYHYLISIQNNQILTSDSNSSGIYSNIVNGSGIFAGYNLKEFELEF